MLKFTQPTIDATDLEAVDKVLRSGWITTGPKAREFEQALASYLGGGSYVRVLNSGTSALEAALLAADIGPGDEVIVPAMSFVSTAHVVLRVGARPVFADVDLDTRNITADSITAALSPNTRAVMPVHFAGLAVEMEPIHDVAQKYGLRVIEDAAHAIGSRHQERLIGSTGDMICFSFHPNKNMTTIEGGAVACFDRNIAERLERIRFHGILKDEQGGLEVSEWGGKMNLPDVNAALGLAQLTRLETFNSRRRKLAHVYLEALPRIPRVTTPVDGPGHSWHMFNVRIDFSASGLSRQELQQRIRARKIETGTHYPPIHLFALYRRQGYCDGDFPNAEKIGANTLTLPLFPSMDANAVEHVCEALHAALT